MSILTNQLTGYIGQVAIGGTLYTGNRISGQSGLDLVALLRIGNGRRLVRIGWSKRLVRWVLLSMDQVTARVELHIAFDSNGSGRTRGRSEREKGQCSGDRNGHCDRAHAGSCWASRKEHGR